MQRDRRQFLGSWTLLSLLAALALVLGILQYRWIGDVSRGERERLRSGLQNSLARVARDFNTRLSAAGAALVNNQGSGVQPITDEEYASRYERWRESARYGGMFRRVAIARPAVGSLVLSMFDPGRKVFTAVDWPSEWYTARDRMQAKLSNAPDRGGPVTDDYPALIEKPHFGNTEGRGPPRESEWVLLEVDLKYLGATVLPGLLRHDLGDSVLEDYDVRVSMRGNPSKPIYESDPAHRFVEADADASVNLFEFRPEGLMRSRRGPPRFGPAGPHTARFVRPPGPPPNEPSTEAGGRWRLSLRHRAGSLESVVRKTRWRNLFVGFAMLLLMIAAGGVLVRFTRRAQKLAELQMEFVAGVSHELRTPLSVMRTAGYNLRGPVASNAARVRSYGALIQQESERLSAVVEQILQFSNARAGRALGLQSQIAIDQLIDDAIAAERGVIAASKCTVEKRVEADLLPVRGDPVTLTQAIQNLIRNAANHGNSGAWIGVSAHNSVNGGIPNIEIQIADRGSGVPAGELRQIFEPFYRGKRAVAEQIHGTGLGLSLVKRIIEAHEGTISARSMPGHGTEFLIRLPAAAIDRNNAVANSAG